MVGGFGWLVVVVVGGWWLWVGGGGGYWTVMGGASASLSFKTGTIRSIKKSIGYTYPIRNNKISTTNHVGF